MRRMMLCVVLCALLTVMVGQAAMASDLSWLEGKARALFAASSVEKGTWIDSEGVGVGWAARIPLTDISSVTKDIPVVSVFASGLSLYGIWPGLQAEPDGDMRANLSLAWRVGPGIQGHIGDVDLSLAAGYDIKHLGEGADGGERRGYRKVLPHGIWLGMSGAF